MTLITFLALIVAVEAITEIVVASEIFAKFRERTFAISQYFGKLISCGYCFSVWVSAFLVGFVDKPELTNYTLVNGMILAIIIHRLSNIWHEFVSRWLNRAPIALAIHKTETVIMENHDGDQNQEG